MAQLDLTTLTTTVQDWAPNKNSAAIRRAANMALERLYSFVGPTVRFTLTTTAVYKTGTLAITQGDTAVTLTGGTFAAGTDKQIIRAAGEDTWYTFTRLTGTTGTLGSAFSGATITAGTFTIAYAFYDLPTDISSTFNIWRGPRARVRRVGDEEYVRFMDAAQEPGIPINYAVVRGTHATNSAVRIMLIPYPDAIYTFTISGRARPTQFTGSGTEYTGIPEDYDNALLAGTLYYVMDQRDKQDRSAWWFGTWENAISEAKGQQNEGFDTQYGEAESGYIGSVWQNPVA